MWLSRTMKVGRPLVLPEDLERVLDAIDVVGVADPQDVPAVTEEPGRDVLREGDARVPFDGDVVVVVDPAEVVEAEVAGQRRRFRRDALHHAAVAADGVDVVVEDLEARPVVAVGEPLLGDAPCRRSWRRPARAGRWWSRRPRPSDTRDARAPCCRAGGSGGCRRASPRAGPASRSRRSPPVSW